MRRLKSPHGAPMAFLLAHVSHKGDACLTWPFVRFPNGYACIRSDGAMRSAARVMCKLAHGEPPTPEHDSAHSCGNGNEACIHPDHLIWKTHAANQADMVEHGTAPTGERHGMAKLTAEQVGSIRVEFATSPQPYSKIARAYGVNATAIGKIIRGDRWALPSAGPSADLASGE